ncbi:MAG: YfiR family protein [Sphingobacteriaceae bacterium]
MRLYLLSCILSTFLFLSFTLTAGQPSDYAIKANIIYHFTKYIDWPESKKSGEFIIGIIGETRLYNELQKIIADKRVGNQKIVIKKFSESANVNSCHILFISDDQSSSLKSIVGRTAGRSVLLVSESDGLARRGSCINFDVVSERLKLEVNKNNIEERNLSIANELLKLAILVK